MIRITNWKQPIELQGKDLERAIRSALGLSELHPMTYQIIRRSLDARRSTARGETCTGKDCFFYVYTLDVSPAKEDKVWNKIPRKVKEEWQRLGDTPRYAPPFPASLPAELTGAGLRPVVVGLGPAGLFCALLLARAGLKPLIIERGKPVEERTPDTRLFFTEGHLDPESNVQFGEGGAGAYSDGKLNTLIKDPTRRGRFVMEEFVKAGAPETILYDNKPHVGTDRLQIVVRRMREELLSLGAEIRFSTRLDNILTLNGPDGPKVSALVLHGPDGRQYEEPCSHLFLGIGHSARDTFQMLSGLGARMEEKPFAMGLRIEHPREMIDRDQYRSYAGNPLLGAASYKLTWKSETTGRSLYTFCMCPGGVVIASASEPGTVVTNGMSNYARDEVNSNSALLVNVLPDDFAPYREQAGVLSGAFYQRELEKKAFALGGGTYHAPCQTTGDFLADRPSAQASFGEVIPSFTGGVTPANLRELLPPFMADTIAEGLAPGGPFGRKIRGFDRPDAVLTGIESRSSSPVRILRDDSFQSNIRGLYPMGEGAGYAGGITSAAIDGMKAAEAFFHTLFPVSSSEARS
ncbi:MAG: hypothetical protein HUJ69_01220 [Lachnospiraceae bacterium]|nr:hypothetical protein [Lachnospiraceae bacterium]